MIVDLAVYTNGVRQPGTLDLHQAHEASQQPDSFVWLGLYEPTFEEFDSVQAEFGLHELAVEDAVRAHQRPKVETYGENLFFVLRTARYVDESETVEFGEIQAFLGENFIIAVRHAEASKLRLTRKKLEADPEQLAHGPSAVLHAIVDQVVDDYDPVIDGIDNDLREVEAEVFTNDRRNPAARIYLLKREVLEFQRNLEPLSEALGHLCSESIKHINPNLHEYFRDVQDHVLRTKGRVRTISELLSDALEANLAQVSVRQNDDMRTISAWVAIAAIPTLIGAVYGMNFKNMPELEWPWAYPTAIGVMVALCVFVWWRFKKAGWL